MIFAKTRKRSKLVLTAMLMIALIMTLSACGGSGGRGDIEEVKSQSYSVDLTGVGPSDNGTTYGEFIESHCPGGTWEQFTGDGGDRIVEYDGGDSPEGSVNIQWMKQSSGWAVYAMEIEGEGVSQFHINTFFSSTEESAAEPIDDTEPAPPDTEVAEDPVPAEPYITTETLNGLTAEDSPHYTEVINAHDAEAKGMDQYVIQDPNTTNVKLYTIDLPTGTEIKRVSKFVPIDDQEGSWGQEGDWGKTDASGVVIDLGTNDIEEGEADANSPSVQVYIFDKPNMSPAEFAASIDTTPRFVDFRYGNTHIDRFDDFWVQSTDGLYVNCTWGDMSGVLGGEKNIGNITSTANDNRKIDTAQFPAYYESECWFGGQAFNKSAVDNNDSATQFTTYTFIHGIIGAKGAEGKIPNLNDSAVRELLIDYDTNMSLQSTNAKIDGEYAT
jgi:hypothetical protein